jgi:glycosyltransferase involved in cell wall biosynthesis
MLHVGILLTHPTQYHSPWFQELAKRSEIRFKVFYCLEPDAHEQGVGFDVPFHWDTPLLEGYPNALLRNIARKPGLHFSGCDTPEITDLIASLEFDAWIINGWRVKSDWQALRACWRSRVPMLVRGDSHLIDSKPLPLRIAKRLILGRWLPRFNRYLTVGKLNEDYYQFYGADPKKFFPVRHFVDNERFASQAERARIRRPQLRSRWGIDKESVVFLFAGKFIDKKRPMDAIRATELLHLKGLPVHLLMVGDGKLRPKCEQYSKEKELPVSFTGFLNQSEIHEAYVSSDVLVLPSAYAETWGLVANEAMSCGLPAIVSDRVGCGPDLVKPGKTGATFPVADVVALANAMTTYAEDVSLAKQQGANAAKHVDGYSVAVAADNTIAALLSLT